MTTPDAAVSRLLLFADSPRAAGSGTTAKVRRYRLARLARLDPDARPASGDAPRYAYLKRSHD